MYQVSSEFHTNVLAAGARSRLLLRFGDGVFLTGDDVTGIDITYPLNEETELTVGKCVAAELSATVLNCNGLLTGYGFGSCRASLGVVTGSEAWTAPTGATAAVVYGYGTDEAVTFAAYSSTPYLTADGVATAAQPGFAPDALVIVDGMLYAGGGGKLWAAEIGADGGLTEVSGDGSWNAAAALTWDQAAAYTWGELSEGAEQVFMAQKLGTMAGQGMVLEDAVGYMFAGGAVEACEYVPLGVYYIDAPEQRRVATLAIEARDGMQKFEVDCDDWWAGLTWPKTRLALLQSLCGLVGVALETTSFPGSGVSIASAPLAGNGLTAKEVLGWIAESAGSYARMSRDGGLALVWFGAVDVTIAQTRHFGDSPAEYTTPPIEALHVMAMESDIGVMVPEGGSGNEYQVVDNPLLYGATEAEIRAAAEPMYTRLKSLPPYTPNSVEAVGDWSLEPGDIVQVVGGDGATRALPIFRMVLRWNGGARMTLECTGGTGRKPSPASSRRELTMYRAYNRLTTDIEGIHAQIGDVEGNVASLEITAASLSAEIAGKIDGEDAQTLINQTLDNITLSVTSGAGGSTFTMTGDGIEIVSNTVSVQANKVDFNNLTVSGTLSASYITGGSLDFSQINAENLTVTNAMIDTLYASKIIGGGGYGYIASGAISDSAHYLPSVYGTTGYFETQNTEELRVMRLSGTGLYAVANANGVKIGGNDIIGWADVQAALSGGGSGGVAKFG